MEFRTIDRRSCPICGNNDVKLLFSLKDDRYAQSDSFPVSSCNICEFFYLSTAVHPDDLVALYSRYYPHPAAQFVPTWRHRGSLAARFARIIDGNVNPAYSVMFGQTVLDVGCGSGDVLKIAALRGATVEGLEIDPRNVAHVRGSGFPCHQGTVQSSELTPSYYDYVLLNQVLEHDLFPVQTLRHCAKLLKPSGKILTAAPYLNGAMRSVFGRQWISWHVPYHVNQFSHRAIHRAADYAGLKVQSFKVRTPGNWILMQLRHRRVLESETRGPLITTFPFWKRALVAPFGRLLDILGLGECFLATLTLEKKQTRRLPL